MMFVEIQEELTRALYSIVKFFSGVLIKGNGLPQLFSKLN